MRGYMFRNRWFALLFVGMVLAGVTRIVGTEEDKGALDAARDRIVSQHQQANMLTSGESSPSATSDVVLEFTPDEELIDPASGYDPTPVDEFAATQDGAQEVVPDSQVVIVSQDGGRQTGQ